VTAALRVGSPRDARPLRRRGSNATAVLLGTTAGVLLAVDRDGPGLASTVPLGLFFALLSAATVYDLRERRIPNALTYSGVAVALGWAMSAGAAVESLAGFAVGGGVMMIFWLPGGGRMGLGDVKLSAFIGSALGIGGVGMYLMAGTAFGALAALLLLTVFKRSGAHTMAYGPWLSLGAAVAALHHGLVLI
jgi:leader peptidase (prepilin peptidase) / N-methyltransferase